MSGNNPNDTELLEIDEENEEHLGAHGLTLADVEEVLATAVVWVPNIRMGSDRWKVVGYDRGRQLTTVICSYDEIRRALRPITGWESTAAERSKYLKGSTK